MKEYKYCLRCKRLLKNPDARLRGFGDTCWKKITASPKGKLFSANNNCTPINTI